MFAKLLMVLDSVNVSRLARGGTAYSRKRPPPTPTPDWPLLWEGSPGAPGPPAALFWEMVLWRTSSVPPRRTEIPPPVAEPPGPPYATGQSQPPPAPPYAPLLETVLWLT